MPRHVFHCQLRWGDMDLLGHVNNVVYANYLQEARIDMLFVHPPKEGAGELAEGVVVARQEIDYLKPLVFRPEPVRVESWVSRVGTSSYTLGAEIRDDDAVYVRASTVLVAVDFQTGASRPIREDERLVLETFLEPD